MKAFFYALVILRIVHLHMAYLKKEECHTKIITLKQGDVCGKVVKLKKNNAFARDVEVYLGIPYAAPPVTGLRFMPPGAPPRWSETLNAFYMKPACPQMFPDLDHSVPSANKLSPERNIFIRKLKQFLKSESEDCLYLNIYVPHEQDNGKKVKKNYPVILFIHGESFEWNSGNLYDGSVIASYGEVIFVAINFRLGIFATDLDVSFFCGKIVHLEKCLDETGVYKKSDIMNGCFLKQGLMAGRANYGLSDQIAALQWIKGNIAEFGGDTSRITVLGHDTGAACVNFLMLSPVAEGLFHRAILMAGSALSPWALTETPLHYIQLAGELNCSLENNTNCFQRRRKEDIISAFKKFEMLPFESTFTPVVDEVVVLNSPSEHMEKYSSLFSKYDLLAGFNELESYYLIREEEFLKFGMLTSEGQKYLDMYIKTIFKKTPDYALQKTFEKYLGHLRDSPIQTRNAILDALSDMLVMAPVMQTLHYHARTPKNTYFYVFGHHTVSENQTKINNRSIYGDDLPYALGVPLNGPSYHYTSYYNSREEQLSETVLRYFTNFAKTGDPNASDNHSFPATFNPHSDFRQNTIKWPPFRVDRQPFMYLGIPLQLRYRYREEYDHFWNIILPSFVRSYDGTVVDAASKNDTIENDDSNSPPIYEITSPESNNYNAYNNFHKITNPNILYKNAATAGGDISTAETSRTTVTVLIICGAIFLVVNLFVFIFLFYQRGKIRVRENLFRNRFRCRSISVPDIFGANDTGEDIYAIATSVAAKEKEDREGKNLKVSLINWKDKAVSKLTGKEKRKRESVEYDYDTIRVASVKPEAISGKRMKRWPLSRQCSGSTITVDAHSKVRNWIAQEMSSRRQNNKNRKTKGTATSSGAIPEEKKRIHDRRRVRKVSIAVDATPAARTGSVLKQIPIEMTKSLDNGKNPLTNQMRTSCSMSCIRNKPLQRSNAFLSEDSEEYYQRTGTHKSSAHIRLRTPEFTLDDRKVAAPLISHVHTRSDPSPMDRMESQDAPIYSRVNKEAKRLKSFADSTSKTNSLESNSTNTPGSHYEDMASGVASQPHQSQETLTNIMRRNFPKVLPDFPQTERKLNNRLSLPPCSTIQLVDCCSSRSARIPPAPPPRLHSTMKRNVTPGRSLNSNSPDRQFSQITVQLRKVNETSPDNGEKQPDIIQTEEGPCNAQTSVGSTREKIELNDQRKMMLILPATGDVDSDHIPDDETQEIMVENESITRERNFP